MHIVVCPAQEELAALVRQALDELPDEIRAVVELEVQPPYTSESPDRVRERGRIYTELHG